MGYLTRKQYLRFFNMMEDGPRVRWFHRIPFIGWKLFQRAVRKYSLEQIRRSIRERLMTQPGEFHFHPKYGVNLHFPKRNHFPDDV